MPDFRSITLGLLISVFSLCIATPEVYAEDPAGSSSSEPTSAETNDAATEETDQDNEDGENTPKRMTLTTKDWHDLERPKVSTDKTKIDLLLKEVDERELLKLQAGDEEFVGLFLEYNTPQPLGAVLILHDEGLHPDNNQLVAPLRKYLPDYGWNTLAIAIPEPDITPLPDRKWPAYPADFTLNPPMEDSIDEEAETDNASDDANKDENSSDTASDESTDDTANNEATADTASDGTADSNDTAAEPKGPTAQEITMMRIDAAIKDLINRGQLNIVLIGQGIGASWAVSYLESSGSQEMFTLVMVDPKLPKTESDKNYINTRIGEFGNLPIMDIISQQTQLSKSQAKERINIARRKQLPSFQQLFTRPVNDPWTEHHRIVKRVRGWLAQNAPGEEQPIR
ncbi:hypothetical protein GCM10007876_38760 [Litoribrevibacter albus]|uniref:DUF3530 family protein n=2 Tax=Litoribrevibacter albus TaxID=1473156 RepID=A0AA37SFH4_9GAMM|nr:hypothetical protein GCM10007876_38760 [Litoribrevibacter albus]